MKDFQDILNYTTDFTYDSKKYSIEVNNTRFEGVSQTTATLKDCQVVRNRFLVTNLHLDMGNPRIVSDVYYTNMKEKNAKINKIQVAAYASSDIVYQAEARYNQDWKRITVIHVNQVKTSQFFCNSDCEDTTLFCNTLHAKLDDTAWEQVYDRIPYLIKQIVFRTKF